MSLWKSALAAAALLGLSTVGSMATDFTSVYDPSPDVHTLANAMNNGKIELAYIPPDLRFAMLLYTNGFDAQYPSKIAGKPYDTLTAHEKNINFAFTHVNDIFQNALNTNPTFRTAFQSAQQGRRYLAPR